MSDLYLQHIVFGNQEEKYMNMFKSGYLKPGYKIGQSAAYGDDKLSKWIYTRISTGMDNFDRFGNLYLDFKLLLNTKFILHNNWLSEDEITKENNPTHKIIDGKTLTKYELKKLLLNFRDYCKSNYNYKIAFNKYVNKNENISLTWSSNEILIKNDIDLHKYLKKVFTPHQNVKKYLKENYKNVTIMRDDSFE